MRFYTKDFEDWSWMPEQFTADGVNSCPVFYVEDIPSEAQSLAIICHDPDATSKVPWIHWLVWNIPCQEGMKISEESLPDDGAIHGVNSFGNTGYGGPSPSPGSGRHRYVFTLYAIKGNVSIENYKIYEEIDAQLMKQSVKTATWTGLYERE